MGALRKAVIDGDIKYGSLMAGQSVGIVNEVKPIKKIIDDFISEELKELDLVFRGT